MVKNGLKQYVFRHSDPTYQSVADKFVKEAREAKRQKRSMHAFRVFDAIRRILSIAGYEVVGEIVLRNKEGHIFRWGQGK
jgi:precorrin isomerase